MHHYSTSSFNELQHPRPLGQPATIEIKLAEGDLNIFRRLERVNVVSAFAAAVYYWQAVIKTDLV
jgi:hypothetical protein